MANVFTVLPFLAFLATADEPVSDKAEESEVEYETDPDQ